MKLIRMVALLLFFLLPGIVNADVITQKSLNGLMELSGINKQIAEFPGLLVMGLEQAKQQNPGIPEPLYDDLKQVMIESFTVRSFLTIISKKIKNTVTEKEAKEMLKWYKSNLGIKITKAEEAATKPAAYQEMTSKAQSLLADKQRVALSKKMDRLVGGTEMSIQLQENMALSIFTAISSAMAPGKPVNTAAFKKHMEPQMKQLKATLKQNVIISGVYSYKNVDINSINTYISFLEKQSYANFNKCIMQGIITAFNTGIKKMSKSLAETVKKTANKDKV